MPAATDAPAGPALLLTKLRPPAPRELVDRRALLERLATGRARRLTVVRAGAGWGKTSLMAQWATSPADPRRFAWLSLDPADDEPARFWTYAVAALQTLEPDLGAAALARLRAPGADPVADGLPQLINDLADLAEPVVLVLDDHHLVGDPRIDEALCFLVEHAPPTFELALATRREPRLPLGRLRARGELLEIGPEQLALTGEETGALLNDVGGLRLSVAQVDALRRRTEGWAAGLYLAALSLREREDRDGFIDAFSGNDRHVVDFLSLEVLGGLPDGVRDFLLRTSVLDRLTPALCDAVTGTGDGAARLREIERSNLFLIALDDRRETFRYHHLFADLLRAELVRTHPALVPEVHRAAAIWHLDAGDVDRAIQHRLAAGDLDVAIELIAEHWTTWLLLRGAHATIDRWLRALPESVVRADPRLCVARTFTSHSLGRAPEVTALIDAADTALGADAPARIRGEVAAARASNRLQTGRLGAAREAADRSLAVGDPESPWVPIPHGVRAHALRWSGDAQGARRAFGDWLGESELRGQRLGVVCSHAEIALIDAEAGDIPAAAERAARALELARPAFEEHWVVLAAHVALARLARADGDAAHAAASARRAVALARRGGVPGDRANALIAAWEVLGEPDLLTEARGLLEGAPDPGDLVLRRLATAERRAGAAPPAAPGDELSERELGVLRLLATDLTQREIGDALYVSLNTVKTHTRHIFRKLEATGRADAVRRARERGLLA